MINRVKGTQDFIDTTLFNYAISQIHDHLISYHFSEIKTPVLEHIELFTRSLGTVTVVVNKEMFIIKPSVEGGKETLCLRPEATAPTVRAFIENTITRLPWKVFSTGPMFRYERPQKGRYRQFHQTTIEIIGSASIAQDAQLIMMLDRLFHEKFNLDNYALNINFLGTYEDRKKYTAVLKTFLEKNIDALCGFCQTRKDSNIMRIFDCKNPECQTLYRGAPHLVDHLSKESKKEWEQLQEYLDLLSVSFSHNPTLVRGLDYYNKTVFEFVSENLGAQSAFCAGGRYDQLVEILGGPKDMPSLGAAIGIERLLLLLEPIQDKLVLPQQPALHVVMPLSDKQQVLALLLADELRAQGLCTDVLVDGGSVKSMMRKANKMGAAYVLMLGKDEQQKGEVLVKNMANSTEQRVAQIDLAAHLK